MIVNPGVFVSRRAVGRRGGLHGVDRRCHLLMVGVHLHQQRHRVRIAFPHERPQPVVLAAVVRAEEVHHPVQVFGHRDSASVVGRLGGGENVPGPFQVATQRVVHHTHHPGVRRFGRP